MASKVNQNAVKVGKELDSSIPETLGKIAHPAAKTTAAVLPVINKALEVTQHRSVGTFLAQEKHRTPAEFLAQKDHRTISEFLQGVQSRNH